MRKTVDYWPIVAAITFLLACSALFSNAANAGEVKLPDDRGKMYLTVFGDKSDPLFMQIQRQFDSDPQLIAAKNQTHYNVFASDSTLYVQRYKDSIGGPLPCVRLQYHSGEVVKLYGLKCEWHGREILHLRGKIVESIAECLGRQAAKVFSSIVTYGLPYRLCPSGNCPCPGGNCNCPSGCDCGNGCPSCPYGCDCPNGCCIHKRAVPPAADPAPQPIVEIAEDRHPYRIPLFVMALVFVVGCGFFLAGALSQ